MTANATHRIPLFLLGIISLVACAQESAVPVAADPSPQVVANQPATSVPLKTADGIALCPADFESGSAPDGVFRVGGKVSEPIPTKAPKAAFPDEARKYARKFMKEQHAKRFETASVLGLTVDTNGNPHDICVLKEAGHGFDRKASETLSEYHFKPATLDGKPVAVRLAIEVKFALW